VTFFSQVIKQMWPYIDEYVQALVVTSVEASIQQSALSNFKFETFDLGDTVCSLGAHRNYGICKHHALEEQI
jgi:hypothetical protein